MSLKDFCIGKVDGRVMNIFLFWKHGQRGRLKVAKSERSHFRPARPAVIEPPIMMMAHERDAASGTSGGEFAREEQVASDAEIVCPDDTVLRRGAGEESFQRQGDLLGDAGGGAALFGQVIKRRLNLYFDGHSRQLLGEPFVPAVIGTLAGSEYHLGDRLWRLAHEMWHSEFDDAPYSARAQMKMDDDQPHNPGSFADGPRGSTGLRRKSD